VRGEPAPGGNQPEGRCIRCCTAHTRFDPFQPVQVWRSERCDAPGFGRVWSLEPEMSEDRATCIRRVRIPASGLSKRTVLNTHRVSGRRVFRNQVAAKGARRRNACRLFNAECNAPPQETRAAPRPRRTPTAIGHAPLLTSHQSLLTPESVRLLVRTVLVP
jgi:hypothetical protein